MCGFSARYGVERADIMSFSDIFLFINYKFLGFVLDSEYVPFFGAFVLVITGILCVTRFLKWGANK